MKKKLDKQLNRIFISSKDIEKAVHYFGAAQRQAKTASTEEDWQAISGLIVAGIVAYGRPFSGNEEHERAVATPPFSESELLESEKSTHRRLLRLRNKAIAHSDAELNPAAFKEHRENGFLIMHRLYNPLTEQPNTNEFLALAKKVQAIFVSKVFELSRRISQIN